MSEDTVSESGKLARVDCGFNTTRWSAVLAAGESNSTRARAAFEQLCRTCWFPLYACIRRRGRNPNEDLTQEFFLRLQNDRYGSPILVAGKLRTSLLTSLKHF